MEKCKTWLLNGKIFFFTLAIRKHCIALVGPQLKYSVKFWAVQKKMVTNLYPGPYCLKYCPLRDTDNTLSLKGLWIRL